MIHPPNQDESQNQFVGNHSDSGFRRPALGDQNRSILIALKSNIAKGLLMVFATYPQLSAAQEFTAAQVLEWDQASQDALFQNSISMIAVVGSQKNDNGEFAQCVSDWYGGKGIQKQRNDELRDYLEKYQDHNPLVIVFALIQDVCGKIFD